LGLFVHVQRWLVQKKHWCLLPIFLNGKMLDVHRQTAEKKAETHIKYVSRFIYKFHHQNQI